MTPYRSFENAIAARELNPHGMTCAYDQHGIPPLVWVTVAWRNGECEVFCLTHWNDIGDGYCLSLCPFCGRDSVEFDWEADPPRACLRCFERRLTDALQAEAAAV